MALGGLAGLVPQPVRADDFTPVVGSVLSGSPIPVQGSDGGTHLVYELVLTNAKAVPATLEKIEVLAAEGGAAPLVTLQGAKLQAAMHTLGARPATSTLLAPNEGALVFLQLRFEKPGDVPARLVHRLGARGAASPAAREPSPIQYPLTGVEIGGRRPPVLRPPLEGAGWVALNGCCAGGGAHRGAVQTVNGELVDSQRFAIDWMRLDDQGRLVDGDAAKPDGFVGYGATVHAAGDGTVVETGDGLPDQVPGKLPDPSTITIANVDGNHVVIDHGDGVFTFYAHLQSGSLKVAKGDRVRAGQQLGLLGNSGNTSAPHLHFHAMAGPSPLGSNGIPFEHDHFTLTGQLVDEDLDRLIAGGAVKLKKTDERIEKALPLDLNVVDFGAPR